MVIHNQQIPLVITVLWN